MRRLLLSLVALLLVVACGPLKYQLKGSPLATGADALVIADIQADQGFTRLQIDATNLPPPGRIKDGCMAFAVWQRKSSDAPWTRIGGLTYDEKARTGSLVEVTVPEVAFDLQVTVEITAGPATPSSEIVFAQRVEKK